MNKKEDRYDIAAAEPIAEEQPSSDDSKELYWNNRCRWRRITHGWAGIALQRERKGRHGFSIRRSEHHPIAGGDGGRTTERKGARPRLFESHPTTESNAACGDRNKPQCNRDCGRS